MTVGVLRSPAEALNRGHISRMSRNRPWVRVKVAASLDGRTALASGASRWITGDAARADVHRWRARSSAVLTGIGTVLADDPALTARLDDPEVDVLQPARVIVDSRFRTPVTANTLRMRVRVGHEPAGRPHTRSTVTGRSHNSTAGIGRNGASPHGLKCTPTDRVQSG